MAPPRPPIRLSGAPELTGYLAQLDAWMRGVESKLALAYGLSSFLSGSPGGPQSTLSIPHNDSFIYADDVDNLHPANLRYVMPRNVQKLASARLSIHLAPYRTYNTISGVNTGNDNTDHVHGSATHNHTMWVDDSVAFTSSSMERGHDGAGNLFAWWVSVPPTNAVTFNTTPANTLGRSAFHQHPLNLSQTLGVTEGATATGVTISFDGVDATAALGGPFSADVIELDVTKYLPQAKGVWHTIALTPSGIGRIEAHLRLAVFVNVAAAL